MKKNILSFVIILFVIVFHSLSAQEIHFTPEELEWIKMNSKNIRVGIHTYPPLIIQSDANDSYDGITIEYLHAMEKKLGIKFKIVNFHSWSDVLKNSEEKNIDIVFAAQKTPERTNYLEFTSPYIVLSNKIISRKGSGDYPSLDSLHSKKVALVEGSALYNYVKDNYPNVIIIPVKDEIIALAKLASGEVDASISEISRISYFYEKELFTNIFISGEIDFKYEFRFGVRKDYPILRSILDKTLSSITEEEKMSILAPWIKIKESRPYEKPIVRKIAISLIVVIIIIFLLNWQITLNRLVNLRTKQLMEALEKAEKANQTKTSFLSNMSHEIRTPLNGVIGFATLLEDTKLDSNQKNYTQNLIASANHLMNLINDILDFSKLQSGKMEVQLIECNLLTITQEIIRVLTPEVNQKKISIYLDFGKNVPSQVKTDPFRVRQILFNLIGNAVKFTNSGKVHIKVSTDSGMGANKLKYKFEIEDTGIGIPPTRVGDLFKEFTQIDMSSQRKYGGTGLGLVISHSLAHLLGGDIYYLPQQEGTGSIFVFEVDFEVIEKPAQIINTKPLTGLKTLIVDDTPIGRKVVHSFIDSWEMRNGQFSSGPMAIGALLEAKASGDPYQIAIIDFQMPDMNGIELAKNVRMYPELNDLCMILLSSVEFPESITEIQKAGFSAYLMKPISSNLLLSSLLDAWNLFSTREDGIVTQYLKEDKKIIPEKNLIAANTSKSPKILIVDDNEINVILLSAILKKLNIICDTAVDGYDAIEKAKQEAYDLIFMDIEMPGLDGIETLIRIKTMDAYSNKNLIVIATTAHVLEGSEEKFLSAGFN